MTNIILEAKNVAKTLGSGAAQVQALKGIDLRLHRGEFTMLMGPSGSGKTTLLSILGCMLAPTTGTVLVCGQSTDGADVEQLALLRRQHIGFVFQQYHLFPTLTATENVQIALDLRGVPAGQARASSHEALVRVGLADKVKSFPRELSGGEQQRVAIARAIVANPSAILADEPTASLDTENGQAIMLILSELAADLGRSVLVVTHDSRLMAFADRIVNIEDGRIVGRTSRRDAKPRQLTAVAEAH